MAKSFKRAIACLLAVLMVAFSMPFTALAAPGDYEPDIEMNFYPVYLGQDYGDYTAITGTKNGGTPSYHVMGLDDVAFNYNPTSGTLTMPVTKAQAWLDEYFEGSAEGTVLEDGDWTLGVGDYFAAVVVCKNISTFRVIAGLISYSDNIQPAVIYDNVSGTGRNAYHRVTFDKNDYQGAATASSAAVDGVYLGVDAMAYGEEVDTESNEFKEDGLYFSAVGGNPYTECETYASAEDALTDPKTGALGYTFANECIIGTFLFEIVDEGPIVFAAGDPDGAIYPANGGGYYIADLNDGDAVEDYTTLAPNSDDPSVPGSQKMTFFAEKEEEPEETYYTVTYVDADGETISTEEVLEGGSPASIPDLPTSEDAHVSYDWDTNPSGAVINAATTFTIVKSTSEHEWSEWTETTEAVPASCLVDGKTAIESRTCSICGEAQTRGGEVVPAYGHHDYTKVVTDPTCDDAGYTTYTCAEGDDTYVADPVDALGHDWGAWEETSEAIPATCTATGMTAGEKRVCNRDASHVETRGGEEIPVDPNNHTNIVTDAAVEPDCLTTGLTEGSHCEDCGTVIVPQETVDALGHEYTSEITTPATCTEDGVETFTCIRGDDSYTKVIPATGHEWSEWTVDEEAIPAGCETEGKTAVEKRVCANDPSHVETRGGETIEATGHEWGEWTVVEEEIPATETTAGKTAVEQRVCANDDSHVETIGGEVIPALDHTHVLTYVAEVAPECEADGHIAYFVCDDGENPCGKFFADAEATQELTAAELVIPATGHKFTNYVSNNDATCLEDGTKTAVCDNGCGTTDTIADEGSALGHEYTSEITTPATCTEDGVETFTCIRGDDSYTKVIPATGHDWSEWTVAEEAIPAGCETEGKTAVEQRVCANDASHVETRGGETIEATGHEWGEWTVTKEATESEEGEETRVCANDPSHVETRAIPVKGHTHTLVKVEAVDATCAAAGNIEYYVCADSEYACGKYFADAEGTQELTAEDVIVPIDADAHAWGEWNEIAPAVAPTRTEAGKTATEQRVCANDASHVETRGGEEIPAIEGVLITVPATEYGTVTQSGTNAYEDGILYAYGSNYRLTAEAKEGYEFVGWTINGRLLSEAPSYSNVAYTDLVIDAVFAPVAQDNFTVTFFGKYGDTVAVATSDDLTVPAAPALPGYTFTAWTIDGAEVTEDDILALTDSAQVWAKYEKNTEGAYTITADGAEITLPNGIENGAIPYDTKATVKFEGATSIVAIDANGNESIVASGDTYTFYVGGDITLQAAYDELEEAVVSIISAEKDATSGKYSIVANRAVPEGWTVKDRGFVVGLQANVSADKEEIVANLDTPATGVKVYHGTPTASEQFSYLCKIGAGKTIRVYAFITIQKGSETKVVISDYTDVTGA